MLENWGILGHEWAVEMLKQHIVHGAVRHAYLITGDPELGRRTLALRFAQALTCTAPPEEGNFCGECRDCRQIDRMQHPDLFIVQADAEGSALKVEQVRELQRSLALAAYQSKYRIALLLRFEEATESAANALLKTLEEAPAHVILLLTARDASQLLPTISSRCEILRLRPLQVNIVERHLLTIGAEKSQASLLAHLAGGRPGYALRLLSDESALAQHQVGLNDLKTLLSATRVEKFAYAERLVKDREQLRTTLNCWLSFWRDVCLKASGADATITNIDQTQEIDQLSKQVGFSQASRILREHESACERLDIYINPRLLVENLLLLWQKSE